MRLYKSVLRGTALTVPTFQLLVISVSDERLNITANTLRAWIPVATASVAISDASAKVDCCSPLSIRASAESTEIACSQPAQHDWTDVLLFTTTATSGQLSGSHLICNLPTIADLCSRRYDNGLTYICIAADICRAAGDLTRQASDSGATTAAAPAYLPPAAASATAGLPYRTFVHLHPFLAVLPT